MNAETGDTLNAFIAELKTADQESDQSFHALLSKGILFFNLSDEQIAHEFDVSRPTVTRWKSGSNAPHPAMRKHVYAWLEQVAVERDKA